MLGRLIRGGFCIFIVAILAVAISWVYSAPRKDLRGTWAALGYGYHLDVGRTVIDLYQVTDISCHHDMRIPAHLGLVEMLEGATFKAEGSRLRLDLSSILNPIYAERTDGLPAICTAGSSTDPFAVFWQAMSEHYAFFDLHGVDWKSRKSAVSDDPWVAITAAMAGLDDGHLYIADGDRVHSPSVPPFWHADRAFVRDTARASISDGLTPVANSGLWYGAADQNIGYIYIEHMKTDTPLGKSATDTAKDAFMQIARALPLAEAYIVDVRFNPGGSDDIAMAYASFFAAKPTPAFSKTTRMRDGFTAATQVVTPKGPRHLPQPVYLLTSDYTGSAAEIFTLAMRELPQVTTMGTNTGGGLSDGLNFTLPNGWDLGLSHQIYLTPTGQAFEGVGIPPDIPLPVDVDAYRTGRDPLIAAAIAQHAATR